jgi:hypothetical protein
MRVLTRGLAVLTALWLAACAAEPVIRTDYDRTVDFSAFRSFGFAEKLGTDVAGYSSLLTQRLKRAVSQELTQRGYVPAEQEPDLLVTFYSRVQDKLRVTPAPPLWGAFPYDYYGPYGWGMYRPWPGYGGYADVQSYSEGTLTIDLIDRQHRQIVWEGVAVSRSLPDDDLPTEQAVDQIVREIFAKFPFRAGST